jgi:hypothetical protein
MSVFHDCHVHLTDYVRKGPDLRQFLAVMGNKVGRAALFGIPLQQKWSCRISGNQAPAYDLQADAPLTYCSFTDAHIAMQYRALPQPLQARLDPMITGFNPADMYAADHIRRVLKTFPGVFTGVGELTIHAQLVSSKLGTEVPSLAAPAIDRIFELAAEVGLLVLIHCDMDTPLAKPGAKPAFLAPMKALLERHPRTTCIWAHLGLGRVVRPVQQHAKILEAILEDPAYGQVSFDISWDELAKYLDDTPQTVKRAAELINRYPDRFLFGTDEVAPVDRARYTRIFDLYGRLWDALDHRTTRIFDLYGRLWDALDRPVIEKLRKGNFERLFDQARGRVRAWERANGLHVRSRAPATPRGAVLAANDNMRVARAAHRR